MSRAGPGSRSPRSAGAAGAASVAAHAGAEIRCALCGGADSELVQLQPGLRIAAGELEERFEVATRLCHGCGLVFSAPQPDAALLGRFYASQDRDLFVTAQEEGGARIPGEGSRRDQAAWIEAALGGLRGRRVLEVGCYDGFLLRLLAERGARVFGVEPSQEASRFARERTGVEVRTGTLEGLEEPGGFDLVVLSHVLEHLRDPGAALRRCRALLRPGGAIFVEVPDVLRPRFESVVNFFTFDHLFNFSPRTLRFLAASCGLAEARLETGFPFPAFRWLGRTAPPRPGPPPPDEAALAVQECRRAVRDYVARREAFVARLQARLAGPLEGWIARRARVAIYGGGFHTEYLLAATGLARARIVGLVDGNPAKQGRTLFGHPVVAPEALPELAPEVVVISSYDFQEEMVASVRRHCAQLPEIVTFYERVAAFSTHPGRAAAAP